MSEKEKIEKIVSSSLPVISKLREDLYGCIQRSIKPGELDDSTWLLLRDIWACLEKAEKKMKRYCGGV